MTQEVLSYDRFIGLLNGFRSTGILNAKSLKNIHEYLDQWGKAIAQSYLTSVWIMTQIPL